MIARLFFYPSRGEVSQLDAPIKNNELKDLFSALSEACKYSIFLKEHKWNEQDQEKAMNLSNKMADMVYELLSELLRNDLFASSGVPAASSLKRVLDRWKVAEERFSSFTEARNINEKRVRDIVISADRIHIGHFWMYGLEAWDRLNGTIDFANVFSGFLPAERKDAILVEAKKACEIKDRLSHTIQEFAAVCLSDGEIQEDNEFMSTAKNLYEAAAQAYAEDELLQQMTHRTAEELDRSGIVPPI